MRKVQFNFWFFSTVEEAIKVAELIAKRSPVAVQGTKQCLIYARDHTVQEGLDQMVSIAWS